MATLMKIDLTMVIMILVTLEMIYSYYKMTSQYDDLDEEAVHHVGSHILLMFTFLLTLISYKIIDDVTVIAIWGIYALWHVHEENKKLTTVHDHV